MRSSPVCSSGRILIRQKHPAYLSLLAPIRFRRDLPRPEGFSNRSKPFRQRIRRFPRNGLCLLQTYLSR